MRSVIFVTGGNGFIGRHVVGALLASGLRPRVLLSKPCAEFERRFGDAETLVGDLLDRDLLDRGLDGVTAVIHLASKTIDNDGSGFARVNVEGSQRVGERASIAGVSRLITTSSTGVYGHGSHRLADETTPLDPDTPYSRSRAEAEAILLHHHRRGDFAAAILRHRFVYGEGDRAVVPRFINAARRYPFWISGGRAQMSLIWAADLARVVARLAAGEGELDPETPIYHATDGQPLSYRQLITLLCEVFGWKPPRISIPLALVYAPVRIRELLLGIDPETSTSAITSLRLKLVAQDNSFSNSRLSALLPGQKFHPFDEAFQACLEYYRPFAAADSTESR